MQRFTFIFRSIGRFRLSYARSSPAGISPTGQTRTHFPHRMQAVVLLYDTCGREKRQYRIVIFDHRHIGVCNRQCPSSARPSGAPGTVPDRYCRIPMTVRTGVPTGTITFPGRPAASPSIVSRRDTSGIPVRKYRASSATARNIQHHGTTVRGKLSFL